MPTQTIHPQDGCTSELENYEDAGSGLTEPSPDSGWGTWESQGRDRWEQSCPHSRGWALLLIGRINHKGAGPVHAEITEHQWWNGTGNPGCTTPRHLLGPDHASQLPSLLWPGLSRCTWGWRLAVRVFRKTRKGPRGARIPYRRWYVEFRDHRERVRRLAAFADKAASEELGRKIERLAELRQGGLGVDRSLAPFLEGLPQKTRESLAKWGLLEARHLVGSLPLGELLDRWHETLVGRGRTEKHAGLSRQRVKSLFEAAGFQRLSDIEPERTETAVHGLRERRGLGATSANHYLRAARSFTRWAVKSRYLSENPLRGLGLLNEQTDRRRERRALSPEDLRTLLTKTAEGPKRCGLAGTTRALLYRVAAETGFRAGELKSLRASSFDLSEPTRACVCVEAAYSKRRREDTQPLQPGTVALLAAHLRSLKPWESVFGLPKWWRAAEMLREDLKAAGIAYEDDSGRVLDFHALRVTFITNLARAGVAPKVTQSLARHSTPTLTFNVYAKLGADDERAALAALPDLDSPREDEAGTAS